MSLTNSRTFIVLCLLVLGLKATASCPKFDLPASFAAEEKFFSIGTDVSLATEKKDIGTVEEKVLTLTRTFALYNANHQKIASAGKRLLSWGSHFKVVD